MTCFRTEFTTKRTNDLRTQLNSSTDPPTGLLLAVLLAYTQYAQIAVHASGKFVAPLIKHLAVAGGSFPKHVPDELVALLQDSQKLVVELIKKKNATDDDKAPLEEKLERIKQLLQ